MAAFFDPSTLNKHQPSRFYLLSEDYERLADAVFVVQSVPLPVHSQVVSQHSPILRSLFVSQLGQATDSQKVHLEAPWKDYTLEEVACFLWLAYHPAAITNMSMDKLGEHLQGVLRLADQLEVLAMLEAICKYLETSGWYSLEQLIPLVAITERLHLSNTWAALLLKLADVLLHKEDIQEAAVIGPNLLQVRDQLSSTAWATLMACILLKRDGTYGKFYNYGRSSPSNQVQVAGWLHAYGMGIPKKRPSTTGDDKSTNKKKKQAVGQ